MNFPIDAAHLKAALQHPGPFPVLPGRVPAPPVLWPQDDLRAAAVLVPVMNRLDGFTLLFTLRTGRMMRHAGQISFPGGRVDPDDGGPVATALRETWEEIGLPPDHVSILGQLPPATTPTTGYVVTPVVGLVEPDFVPNLNPEEVQEIFEVPLGYILDPANIGLEERVLEEKTYQSYLIQHQGHRIWGLTARVLVSLVDRLLYTPESDRLPGQIFP